MDFPKDLAHHLPSAQDLIHAVGLQARRSQGSAIASGAILFGAGLLVGAGLALLFAPSSGRALRQEIGERAADLRDRAAASVEAASPEAGDRPA